VILTYIVTLVAATVAALALVAWRLVRLVRGPRPATGRLLNEWTWTLVPLLVLGALLWRAMA
jgi:hypothetical protein